MNHFDVVTLAKQFDLATPGKTFSRKIAGKFYTPEAIGRPLASAIADELAPMSDLRIVDPFCGDGRLICWFLEEAVRGGGLRKASVHLWDYEAEAVEAAKLNVSNTADRLGVDCEIITWTGNTFRKIADESWEFDVCITNPPWEMLRPDRREMAHLDAQHHESYITGLREEDRFLSLHFPLSQPLRRFSGWGTNLARVGTEVALSVTTQSGICAIVSPASLLGDQMSSRLREWMLRNFQMRAIHYYPAEARLFGGVDQDCMSVTLIKETPKDVSGTLSTFLEGTGLVEPTKFCLSFKEVQDWQFSIPLAQRGAGLRLLSKMSHLAQLRSYESLESDGLWMGRELDETGAKSWLADHGLYRFTKGRMIERYGVVEEPTSFVGQEGPRVPFSANLKRVVWRDVSRPNQKRRMIASIIPGEWATGNSLHVAYFRDQCERRLRALLVILNSACFEFQVRCLLSTAHMSLGVVRRAHVPNLYDEDVVGLLSEVAEQCLSLQVGAEARAEAMVASLYGLNAEEFASLLQTYRKINASEIDEMCHQFRITQEPKG